MNQEGSIIVVPVYNEGSSINQFIHSWMEVLKGYPGSEMLVLNDGSIDDTKNNLDILKDSYPKLKVIHKKNEGHGKTILSGYKKASKTNHAWVFQVDSDGQFLAEDFEKIWQSRKQFNLILGHRKNRKDPIYRILLASFARLYIFLISGEYIKDANTPFRLIKRSYLSKLLDNIPEEAFAPNIFLSILASKDNNLVHIPITHQKRKDSQGGLSLLALLRGSLKTLIELFEHKSLK